jgi:hypothetical protein
MAGLALIIGQHTHGLSKIGAIYYRRATSASLYNRVVSRVMPYGVV